MAPRTPSTPAIKCKKGTVKIGRDGETRYIVATKTNEGGERNVWRALKACKTGTRNDETGKCPPRTKSTRSKPSTPLQKAADFKVGDVQPGRDGSKSYVVVNAKTKGGGTRKLWRAIPAKARTPGYRFHQPARENDFNGDTSGLKEYYVGNKNYGIQVPDFSPKNFKIVAYFFFWMNYMIDKTLDETSDNSLTFIRPNTVHETADGNYMVTGTSWDEYEKRQSDLIQSFSKKLTNPSIKVFGADLDQWPVPGKNILAYVDQEGEFYEDVDSSLRSLFPNRGSIIDTVKNEIRFLAE